MPKRYLVIDGGNFLSRIYFGHNKEDEEVLIGMIWHSTLATLKYYAHKLKPNKIVIAFDRTSWRKGYTRSEEARTKKIYKETRRQAMSSSEKEKYLLFLKHCNELQEVLDQYTSLLILSADLLEADDLIAGFTQIIGADEDNEIIIISSDSDLLQLISPNVQILDPKTLAVRTLDEWNNDRELFLFEKCIRGDASDNIQSAYPRVRTTRIRKAYEDPYERANLMNETWTDHENTEYIVKHIYHENRHLIDLTKQPEDIRKLIQETIENEMNRKKKFSMFHILRFIGKYKLKKISNEFSQFVQILSM